jgi:uncharacterized protein (AIM24 family)
VTDVSERIQCRWCKAQSPAASTSCERCGAPLDLRNLVTDSGWRQAPQIRDLTEIHFWNSVAQVDGTVVPVVDVQLAAGDWVFFEHHVMLWKDENVAMSVMDTPGGAKRILAGMPFVLSVAQGPGRVSFSRDSPGEIVMLPVEPGTELDAREHAMLLASAGLTFSFEKIQGMKSILALGSGMYLDRFVAQDAPGLLVLHGYGNVMQRQLAEGESIQVEPGGFLYKDASVTMEICTQKLDSGAADAGPPSAATQGVQAAKGLATRGFAGLKAAREAMKSGDKIGGLVSGLQAAAGAATSTSMTLMRLVGPGRVGIQSMYMAHDTQ